MATPGSRISESLLQEKGTKAISETNEETTSRSLIIFPGNLCSIENQEREREREQCKYTITTMKIHPTPMKLFFFMLPKDFFFKL